MPDENGGAGMVIGPPFGPDFFADVFPERLQEHCATQQGDVPVVEVHLADGAVMDLCHIRSLAAQWMAALVFRDPETCEDMDLHFIPYSLIVRIVVSLHDPNRRRIGFQVEAPEGSHA